MKIISLKLGILFLLFGNFNLKTKNNVNNNNKFNNHNNINKSYDTKNDQKQ